jgi:hypothetical protein
MESTELKKWRIEKQRKNSFAVVPALQCNTTTPGIVDNASVGIFLAFFDPFPLGFLLENCYSLSTPAKIPCLSPTYSGKHISSESTLLGKYDLHTRLSHSSISKYAILAVI